MSGILKKIILVSKNIGVVFLSYIIVGMLIMGIGINKSPKMYDEYFEATDELDKLELEIESVSFDSVYEKNKGKIDLEQKQLDELNNEISSIKQSIDSLKSKLK